jgi:hypothetical protein
MNARERAENARALTHVEPGLGAHLLGEEHGGDPELVAAEVRALEVAESLPEAHVPPDGLHHA